MPTQAVILLAAVCALVLAGGAAYFLYNHWWLPRSAKSLVERLRRGEAAGVPPSARDHRYEIRFDAAGFAVADLRSADPHCYRMAWEDVHRGVAFKRDLFTVDCICLLLEGAGEQDIELNEEMAGWSTFVEALPSSLPGCVPWPDWFTVVAFPAFETNETEIYRRGPTLNAAIKPD